MFSLCCFALSCSLISLSLIDAAAFDISVTTLMLIFFSFGALPPLMLFSPMLPAAFAITSFYAYAALY